jgi:hypothetical protein
LATHQVPQKWWLCLRLSSLLSALDGRWQQQRCMSRRKALRLGKFLGNVQDILSLASGKSTSLLPYMAATGEGTYFFIDQFIWYAPRRHAHKQNAHNCNLTGTSRLRFTEVLHTLRHKCGDAGVKFTNNVELVDRLCAFAKSAQ